LIELKFSCYFLALYQNNSTILELSIAQPESLVAGASMKYLRELMHEPRVLKNVVVELARPNIGAEQALPLLQNIVAEKP